MTTENINNNNEPRYCKKCGEELPSTEKHRLCINCRRKRGARIRNTAFTLAALFGSAFLGKQFINNSSDISNDDQDEEMDNYKKA